jgi:hypothetical protein
MPKLFARTFDYGTGTYWDHYFERDAQLNRNRMVSVFYTYNYNELRNMFIMCQVPNEDNSNLGWVSLKLNCPPTYPEPVDSLLSKTELYL